MKRCRINIYRLLKRMSGKFNLSTQGQVELTIKLEELIAVLIGFTIGVVIFRVSVCSITQKSEILDVHQTLNSTSYDKTLKLYNSTLADKLYAEIKILCLVLTNPANHKKKARHVKRTWGSRCNKLMFLTSQDDLELQASALNIKDAYLNLWGKVKLGFQTAYATYYDQFDWFVKGDDDSCFLIENVRHMLYQYNPETAIVIGHKFAFENKDGYMSGSGYIMSKKAMKKFVKRVVEGKCDSGTEGAEDVLVARCLQGEALFIDAHDDNYERQFFPVDIMEHFKSKESDIPSWYRDRFWSKFRHGNLSCCSSELMLLHYRSPQQMYLMDYLLYSFHPFGLVKQQPTALPDKLSFEEILQAANEESSVVDFGYNTSLRNFDDGETF